jgi:WD40 repeat protein
MSGSGTPLQTSLTTRFVFGCNTEVNGNVSFTTDDTIAYVAGHTIVLYNTTDKRQRHLHSSDITDVITAYASGPGKRLAAVAERGDKPKVHVFDLRTFRRKKTLEASEGTSRDFVAVQFSDDDQLMVTLTGAPDWNLTVWNWAKAKVVASMEISPQGSPINHICFSPIDTTILMAIGQDYVKYFRISDKEMRLLHENHIPGQNFLSYCWMRTPEDHAIVGSEDGTLLLFRQGQYGMTLPRASKNLPISCLTAIPGGFVAGSSERILFFSYDDQRADQAMYDDQFKLVAEVETDLFRGVVTSLAPSPTDELMVALTSDAQLVQFPITSPHSLTREDLKYVVCSFHGPKSIIGMDVSALKPLIMTACKDNTLRLWNFEHHVPELVKGFPEDMYCVALHPNGLHCAIGFTDKLRVYHILVDDLRLCLEVPIKGCKECHFAKGGNMIAAANGNSINVYDFHTGERISDLRGHNSKVRGIEWLESGNLLSCGQDGAVYLWDIEGAKRIGEFVQKGTMFTSVSYGNDSCFVVGNDRSLRELSFPDLAPARASDTGSLMGHVAISAGKSVLFCGSTDQSKPGNVRAYAYPVSGDCDDYLAGSRFITGLKLTPDHGFLVSSDDMGCLSIYELRDRKDRFQRQDPTGPPDLTTLESWNSEILVALSELEDKNLMTTELAAKVEELKLHNEYQLKLKEMNYSEKLKEITDKYMQELEGAKMKLELLREECADLEMEFEENMRNHMDRHQNDVQEMETAFQAEIMDCVNSYQALAKERDAQLERLDIQRRQLISGHERYVTELTKDYELKLEEDRNTRLQCEDDMTEKDREMAEIENQVEDDVDMEIVRLRSEYEQKLVLSRETTLKYKGENSMMRKKYAVLQRELEDMKEETRQLLDKEKELHDNIKMLEKEVSAHKKEIKSKDVATGEKEKKIYELKKKNQELDKFKFVLDFKIRELKQQIEPRQIEIVAMREKIKDMDEELEKYHKSNANLDEMIGTVRERIEELHSETREKRGKSKQQENSIATFRSDLSLAIADILNPPKLKTAIETLARDFGAVGPIKPRMDPEVEGEYARHREFLQRSIVQLKKFLEEGANAHMLTNTKLMSDNMSLIDGINKQRDFNRKLKNEVQADIGRIRQIAQQRDIKQRKQKGGGATVPQFKAPGTADPGQQDMDPAAILDRNRRRILALRAAITELESRGVNVGGQVPMVLPPLDQKRAPDQRIAFYTQAEEEKDLVSPRGGGGGGEDVPPA